MTAASTPTTTPELPAWAVAGGPAVVKSGGGRSVMHRTTIEKVNAKSIVTPMGRFTWDAAFSRWIDRRSGGRGWGYDTLIAPDAPEAVAYFAEAERVDATYAATAALESWRREATPEAARAVRAALDALAPYLDASAS